MTLCRNGLSPELPRLKLIVLAPPLIACEMPLATSKVEVTGLLPYTFTGRILAGDSFPVKESPRRIVSNIEVPWEGWLSDSFASPATEMAGRRKSFKVPPGG